MLPFQNKNIIGIDIGTYSIKVICFTGSKGSYALKAASCFRLPKEGGASAPPSSGLLADFIRSQKLLGRKAAALISGPSLVFRHLHLPVMPEKDLKEAIRWEIRKETGIPPDELVCDHVSTGNRTSENTVSVIAFAARRNDIDRTMALYKDSGVELRVIDVVPTALLAAFDMNNTWEEGVNYAMLDMGDTRSTLAILKNRNLAFAREIAIGGRDLTRSIAQGLNRSDDEAEEYKITYGLNVPEGDNTKALVSQPLVRLAAELHMSFDYYQAQFREGSVAKLFLCGGTARLKGIEGFITENIGIPSYLDDPLRSVKVPGSMDTEKIRSAAPCLTIAAGLATRTA